MFSYYFDPTYVLVIIAFLLTLFASMGVKSTFSKYNDVRSSRGITAASAARQILDANGLQNIRVEHVSGDLTDHYSPNENVIRLSDSTYNSTSVAAIGVAAHECGHAVQHQVGLQYTRKVLSAAAMTYVAAVASTALQFLRLVLLANRRRD